MKIIERAILHFLEMKEYRWFFNNCQHFINRIAQNQYYTKTIERVSNSTMAAGGFISLLGLLSGNKRLIYTGLGIAGVAATGKILNRA